jgi:hypothetical protein
MVRLARATVNSWKTTDAAVASKSDITNEGEAMTRFLIATVAAIAVLAVAVPVLAGVANPVGQEGQSVALSRGGAVRVYTQPGAGWSAEIPDSWRIAERGPDVTFRSYDPQAVRDEANPAVGRPFLPPSELRVDVQRLKNYPNSSAQVFADETLAASDPTRSEYTVLDRNDKLNINGLPATLLRINTNTPPQPVQTVRHYFVLTASREFILFVRAWPDRSIHEAELTHFLQTLSAR